MTRRIVHAGYTAEKKAHRVASVYTRPKIRRRVTRRIHAELFFTYAVDAQNEGEACAAVSKELAILIYTLAIFRLHRVTEGAVSRDQ